MKKTNQSSVEQYDYTSTESNKNVILFVIIMTALAFLLDFLFN